MLYARPTSLSNVMSPKPSVVLTVSVQERPMSHECSSPSQRSMMTWKRTA